MLLMWIGALMVGLTVGLLGAGGSILTVPILVYGVGEVEKVAIAESLAIVGVIALAGTLRFWMSGLVSWRMVLLFGLPGMLGAYLGAAAARHVPGALQLGLFAVLMLVAAVMMLRPLAMRSPPSTARGYWKIAADGMVVGAITGLVGVGGGFLIVPALVLMGGLPMHTAVGTSLAIIALNSASSSYKYRDVLAGLDLHVNVHLITVFAAVGVVGSLGGHALSGRLKAERLRQGFGLFLVVVGSYVLWQNLPQLFR